MSVFILLLISILTKIVISYNFGTKCSNCKWFVKNNKGINDLGLCGMFGRQNIYRNNNYLHYEYAKHCRDNEFQCGTNACLFEKKNYKYIELLSKKETNSFRSNDYMSYFSKDDKKYFKYYIKKYAKKNIILTN